jgi:Ras-related protein Rab-13
MREADDEEIESIEIKKAPKNEEFVHYQKINIFGEDGVGKTSFISLMENYNNDNFTIDPDERKLSSDSFNASLSLVEEEVKRLEIEINKETNVYFQLYETSLNKYENIKDYLDVLLVQTECIIVMWDNDNPETFDNIPLFISEIESGIKQYKYPDVPIFVIQNKIDLAQEETDKDTIDQKIDKFKNEHPKIICEEISLIEKDNFYNLILKIYQKMETLEKAQIDETNNENYDIYHVKYKRELKESTENNFSIDINCLLLGNSSVGKTSFINRLLGKDINNIISTIGVINSNLISKLNEEIILLRLNDTSGQDFYSHAIPKNCYRNANCILLFYDIMNQESFNNIETWIKNITETKGQINRDYELFLVGNKIDGIEKRVIERTTAKKLAEQYKIKYFEISCVNKINLYELLNEIILISYRKKKNKVEDKDLQSENSFTLRKKKHIKGERKCC